VTSETRQLSGGGSQSQSYQYDLAGNRTLAVERRGRGTVYGYDERNQLRSETWYLTEADVQAPAEFHRRNRLRIRPGRAAAERGNESFTYDNLDRTASQRSRWMGCS
jgi:YD repeat-containing protein